MSGWKDFDDEVARWRDAGRTVELWWRDDDAIDATPALDRLIDVQRASQAPLALAVVPANATAALAARLAHEHGIDVLQHGYGHVNHAQPEAKKTELGAERPAMMVLGELGTGWMALERLFGLRALPVMVPPWNRIAPMLVPALPEIGFTGLSTFGVRRRAAPVRGLRQVNTHVDLVDWKRNRVFVSAEAALATLVATLAVGRQGAAEPVGLLSHHLVMDEGAWDFLRSLLGKAAETPGVETRSASELFASREARS